MQITPILDTRYTAQDGKFPLVIRVHHKGKRKYIPLNIRLADAQFSEGRVVKHPDAKIYNARLTEKIAELNKYIADAQLHGKPIRLGATLQAQSFTDYMTHRATQYKAKGQIVMSRKVNRFVWELKDCFGGEVFFSDLNADALRTFDAYLINRGNVDNTRHKKFRFLRQFFTQGFDEGLTDLRNPFKQYKIPLKPVKKEKLTVEQIEAIEALTLTGPTNDVRNLFLFSYYAKGSRFENCLTLHHKQIKGGRILIHTNKGGKHISVKIHQRLQAILDQYPGRGLVFPFLKEVPEDPARYLRAVDSQNVIVNRYLKVIAVLAGIDINLTFHVARHTFAFHLKQVSNNVNIIQDALGHSDQRITQVYLKSLGDERLDEEMDKLYGD